MGVRRRAGSVALLVAIAAPGCLQAPPFGGDGSDDGDSGDDGARDGGITVGPDGSVCTPLVSGAFDSADWIALAPAGASVTAEASQVQVSATPSTDIFVYADLHTEREVAIGGSILTVEVDGPIVSVIGEVGIGWHNKTEDDSYQLEVANGQLRAVHITGEAEETEVCLATCPDYSVVEHARLRLLEREGMVHYQSASEAGDWVDIGRAPANGLPHAVLLYASATGPGSGDLTVIHAEWLACGE